MCTCVCMYNIHIHIYISTNIHMGWLQLVGSIELWVSFAEYCLLSRALLQKRPIIYAIHIVHTAHAHV